MNENTKLKTVKMILGIGPRVDWKTKTNKQLVAGFLELQTADEVERFLRDLMTPTEIKEFANRLEAARLLSRDVQYNAISESTGLSSTTIARIAKWLYGSLGGYRLILKRITLNQSKLGTGHSNSSQLRKGLSWN